MLVSDNGVGHKSGYTTGQDQPAKGDAVSGPPLANVRMLQGAGEQDPRGNGISQSDEPTGCTEPHRRRQRKQNRRLGQDAQSRRVDPEIYCSLSEIRHYSS